MSVKYLYTILLLISCHVIQAINTGEVTQHVSGENVMVPGCMPLSLPSVTWLNSPPHYILTLVHIYRYKSTLGHDRHNFPHEQ